MNGVRMIELTSHFNIDLSNLPKRVQVLLNTRLKSSVCPDWAIFESSWDKSSPK